VNRDYRRHGSARGTIRIKCGPAVRVSVTASDQDPGANRAAHDDAPLLPRSRQWWLRLARHRLRPSPRRRGSNRRVHRVEGDGALVTRRDNDSAAYPPNL